jgi:hypothetical protein
MTSTKTVSVNAEELRTTFEFVSFGAPLEHSAYICVDTGKIYCHSVSAGLEEEDLPEDLETSDRYIAVPHKNDLGLGRRLALAFVDQELSDLSRRLGTITRRASRRVSWRSGHRASSGMPATSGAFSKHAPICGPGPSGMFRLKTKLVIKMMRYRCIGLVVKI